MTCYAVLAVFALVAVIRLSVGTYYGFDRMMKCNLVRRLNGMVINYAEAHNLVLPADWRQLEEWGKSQGNHFLDHAEAMERAIDLDWGRDSP